MGMGERLARAFVELALASAVIVGAVIAGHELKGWRDWYPRVHHPWLDGSTPAEVAEPQ